MSISIRRSIAFSVAERYASIAIGFVILEQNGIDHGVGTLRRFDRRFQTFLAADVHSIREDDYRLSTLLLCH